MDDKEKELFQEFEEKATVIRKEYIQKIRQMHRQIEESGILCRDAGAKEEKQLKIEMEKEIWKLSDEIRNHS